MPMIPPGELGKRVGIPQVSDLDQSLRAAHRHPEITALQDQVTTIISGGGGGGGGILVPMSFGGSDLDWMSLPEQNRSDEQPGVCPLTGSLVLLTFTHEEAGLSSQKDAEFWIHRNGVKVYEWVVSAAATAYIAPDPIPFSVGDSVQVWFPEVASSPESYLTLHFQGVLPPIGPTVVRTSTPLVPEYDP